MIVRARTARLRYPVESIRTGTSQRRSRPIAAIPAGFISGYWLSRLTSLAFQRDLFRLPFVLETVSYFYAACVVGAAALLSGAAVIHRLARMDLTAVLKSRE